MVIIYNMCVCVCVYIYIYIYMCVYICMYICLTGFSVEFWSFRGFRKSCIRYFIRLSSFICNASLQLSPAVKWQRSREATRSRPVCERFITWWSSTRLRAATRWPCRSANRLWRTWRKPPDTTIQTWPPCSTSSPWSTGQRSAQPAFENISHALKLTF